MTSTTIPVASLKAAGIEALITARDSGGIPFPYRNNFTAGDRLLSLENEPLIQGYRDYKPRISDSDFVLSFYSTRERLFVPSRYSGTPVLVRWDPAAEISANMLPILYTDYVRVNKALKRKLSLTKAWKNNEVFTGVIDRIVKSDKDTVGFEDFRLQLTKDPNTGESPCFKPTWVKAIFEAMDQSSVNSLLDLNTGCGGVMVGAALSGVNQYVGFQADTDYQRGEISVVDGKDRVLGLDGMAAQLAPDRDFKVHYQDFSPELVKDQLFDIIMTSLPSYNEYDNPTIVKYPSYTEWLAGWLFHNLQTSWLSLKENGYLILHLDDIEGYNLAEPMNLFIEQFLPGSSWKGSVGLENEPIVVGDYGTVSSVWIWQKVTGGLETWGIDRQSRSLQVVYPEISSSLISAYINGVLGMQTGVAKERYESQLGIINNSLQKIISESPSGVQRDQVTKLIRTVFPDPTKLLPFYLSVGAKAIDQWLKGMVRLMTANWNRPKTEGSLAI